MLKTNHRFWVAFLLFPQPPDYRDFLISPRAESKRWFVFGRGECNVSENIISGICVIYVCAIRTLGGNGKRGIRAQGVAEPLGHRFTI